MRLAGALFFFFFHFVDVYTRTQVIPETDLRVDLRGKRGLFVREGHTIPSDRLLLWYDGWLGLSSEVNDAVGLLEQMAFDMYSFDTFHQIDGENLLCSAYREDLSNLSRYMNDVRADPFGADCVARGFCLSAEEAARQGAEFRVFSCNRMPYIALVSTRQLVGPMEVEGDYGTEYWRFVTAAMRDHSRLAATFEQLRKVTRRSFRGVPMEIANADESSLSSSEPDSTVSTEKKASRKREKTRQTWQMPPSETGRDEKAQASSSSSKRARTASDSRAPEATEPQRPDKRLRVNALMPTDAKDPKEEKKPVFLWRTNITDATHFPNQELCAVSHRYGAWRLQWMEIPADVASLPNPNDAHKHSCQRQRWVRTDDDAETGLLQVKALENDEDWHVEWVCFVAYMLDDIRIDPVSLQPAFSTTHFGRGAAVGFELL